MIDQHHSRVEHQELLAGIIASTIANWSYGGAKKPLKPADFMPSQRKGASGKGAPMGRINHRQVESGVREWVNQMRAAGKVITANA